MDDAQVAGRALRGAVGFLDAARATGVLDVAGLSRLLPVLGLASQPADLQALHGALGAALSVESLCHLPWDAPPHINGTTALAHGSAGLTEAALRLAAGHALGAVPATLRFSGEPVAGPDAPFLQLLHSWSDATSPVCVVVGAPALVVDLLSPAVKDLAPVLRVLSQRLGFGPPATTDDAADLLPLLFSQAPQSRDERVTNDARNGVYATAGGALADPEALDPDAVDPRVAGAVRSATTAVVACEPDLMPQVLALVAHRVKAVLILAPSDIAPPASGEMPDRLLDAVSLHAVGGLLADASIQGKDVEVAEPVVVGESALGAPTLLLAGVARRACRESRGAVMDGACAQAAFVVQQARLAGLLGSRVKLSVAAYRAQRAATGRAFAAAFLSATLAGGRGGVQPPTHSARGGGGGKVRIRG